MSDPLAGVGVIWFGLVVYLLGLLLGGAIGTGLSVIGLGLALVGCWEWARGWRK